MTATDTTRWNDALNGLNVQIGQVVGVAVLSGGQLLAFAAPQ